MSLKFNLFLLEHRHLCCEELQKLFKDSHKARPLSYATRSEIN